MRKRQRRILQLILICLSLLLISFWANGRLQQRNIATAVAKGKHIYDMTALSKVELDQLDMQTAVLTDPEITALIADHDFGFLDAVALGAGEAAAWKNQGCGARNCAHIALYDYDAGGTINAILNTDNHRIIARWFDTNAFPSGSEFILPKAMEIAAADPTVRAILGDLGDPEPAMIPMSAWLMDDACREEWCVNLTYHDPAGSGKIFHIFINMEQNKVARTFFTRGRADLPVAPPPPQRYDFSDGCQEDLYGWNVCWEMTANDGVNFYDASFEGTDIFESVKVSQVEAWYPSWPGGYRDEIGSRSSVPPYGPTEFTDFGDSFEVRQLFTEFTHWPNCICCYRYEEYIRFYEDGRFQIGFVSHGPGCDDLSVYRPFYRIDLALDGRGQDDVWVWDTTQWVEATQEMELYPFVDDLSPDNEKLATFDGDTSYRWQMYRSDPLGLDEARVFLVDFKESEGDGPIPPGPGDVFMPPRQWIDGDAVSGKDPVIWWVPLLKTKKSNPAWCQPDPEPGINPCETILEARPAGELVQPTEEELAAIPTATATAVSQETATPAPTNTPRPVEGEDAEDIILNSGCGSCHQIGNLGEGHKVGPDLSNIGSIAAERIDGMSAEEYIFESITDPNAFILADCPNGPCLPNIMPRDYTNRLSSGQIDLMIEFLLEQQAESVSLPIVGDANEALPAPKTPASVKNQVAAAITSPAFQLVQILLIVMTFILTLFLILKLPDDD
ncbi:MAG: hypothetical protein CSB13_00770 [Chloroflexi bacterium]|nr:MAG: hypothetical protein CSB13_00770 [Chloroflexota bacterium]